MEHARHIYRIHVGAELEEKVYSEHKDDLDAYIHAACCKIPVGVLCKGCGKHSAAIEMMQTRSADEGMSAFLVCKNCNSKTLVS